MKKKLFRLKLFTIDQTNASMKVGTDSDLLGTMAYGGKNILDIGTGTGILTLMMAQRFPEAQFTAVEIDDKAVIDASTNFSSSPWSERITLIHDSFQSFIEKEISEQIILEKELYTIEDLERIVHSFHKRAFAHLLFL